MTSPKAHPAAAYTIAIDPQAKHKGTLRIVRRFFMAETVAVVTVHFDYQGKTYSETIRVADLDFPKAPGAPTMAHAITVIEHRSSDDATKVFGTVEVAGLGKTYTFVVYLGWPSVVTLERCDKLVPHANLRAVRDFLVERFEAEANAKIAQPVQQAPKPAPETTDAEAARLARAAGWHYCPKSDAWTHDAHEDYASTPQEALEMTTPAMVPQPVQQAQAHDDDQRRAVALDALRAKAAASVTPRRPAMVAQPVQQAQAQHTPEPAPASILDTPASFKPGTVVVLRRTGSTATVLHPLGDGKRKVRVELYNGEVAYFRPHQLQRDWSAPTIKAEHVGRVMGDGPPILVPMHEAPQPPVLDMKALRSRAILYNLLEVAAAKRSQAVGRIADRLAAMAERPDPLRNVVAPVEPERIPVGERVARFKAYHEERDALGRALEVEDDGRPKRKRR